ncbi:hypothetical protein PMAYCL1PPCAC_04377, partial [Pristionchus mayeri]
NNGNTRVTVLNDATADLNVACEPKPCTFDKTGPAPTQFSHESDPVKRFKCEETASGIPQWIVHKSIRYDEIKCEIKTGEWKYGEEKIADAVGRLACEP